MLCQAKDDEQLVIVKWKYRIHRDASVLFMMKIYLSSI